MKRLIVRSAAVVGATAVSMAVFGSGVAMADLLAGLTYAQASKTISDLKMTSVIAAVVGDQLPTDQCIITRSEKNTSDKRKIRIMLFLNCNAAVASAGDAGNSAASPEGQAAKIAQQEVDYVKAHPEYCVDHAAQCKALQQAHPELF